ncbi:MAG: helicase HerA-like domain-containing protein, partial [Christiangramia sp.]|nr:helicase HerA-like domain-containing protein [Christiangramia sp.]
KYNDEIDRESAYELLNRKIEEAEKTEAKEKAEKQRKEVTKTSTRRRTTSTEGAIIKVLTSATFIRGVMGILNKFLK